MAHTACEMLWLKHLLCELGFLRDRRMHMDCHNKAAVYIANNPVFHERTKHTETSCHFARDVVKKK